MPILRRRALAPDRSWLFFFETPPDELRQDWYLKSENLWERLICITLQAQRGDFWNVELLLEIVLTDSSEHICDAAIRVFVQSAPFNVLSRLSAFGDALIWIWSSP